MRSFILSVAVAISAIACGGSSDASAPEADEGELRVTRTIPVGTYKLVRASGTSRSLVRLTIQANKRFTAEMAIEGRGNPLVWWAPAPSETKILQGSYRLARETPSVMDPDQTVRDGIWLEYEDPTYSYDHYSYEWNEPKLVLTSLRARLDMESDPDYRPEREPPAITIACTTEPGNATVKLVLDQNRNQRGTMKLTKNGVARFPASQTVTVGYDNQLSSEERARFRGMNGEQGFDITVPRNVIEGSRAEFSSSLTYEADQGGSETSFSLTCSRR